MSVVAVINYKGGVGKTTLTANIGAELAARGRKVLLIDLDPQASLTFSFYRPAEFEEKLVASRLTVMPWFEGYLATRVAEPLHKYVVTPARSTPWCSRWAGSWTCSPGTSASSRST